MPRKRHVILMAHIAGVQGGLVVGFLVAMRVVLAQREWIAADVAEATTHLVWWPVLGLAVGYAIGVALWLSMRWRGR